MTVTRRNFIGALMAGGAGWLAYSLGGRWLGSGDRPPLGPARSALDSTRPAYAAAEEQGILQDRIDEAYAALEDCQLCPHRCGVNRRRGEKGFCNAGGEAVVYSHSAHYGEERPLVGVGGSGTIFFSHCNLRCVFCQNWPIAHEGRGSTVSDEQLADMMLSLQRRGCHNINLVTPTHMMPNILGAVRIALQKGLELPLCYNTGGYERVEMVRLLDGIVDIYLPDLKFMDGEQSAKYALRGVPDYPQQARESIAEMHRQVGVLQTADNGVALRGLMLRHLVMPNRVAGTKEFVQWVAENLSHDTYVNIMSQYRVAFQAFDYDPIARAITNEEYVEAMEWAMEAGLTNLDERSLSQYRTLSRRLGTN